MGIYWLGLVLFLFLLANAPLQTGPLFWLMLIVLIYVFTFPGGPAQSIKARLRSRRKSRKKTCVHCHQSINDQDVLCHPCKLELTLGYRRR